MKSLPRWRSRRRPIAFPFKSNMEGSEERGSTVALVVMRWALRAAPAKWGGAPESDSHRETAPRPDPVDRHTGHYIPHLLFTLAGHWIWEPLDPLRWHAVSRHTPCSRLQVTARRAGQPLTSHASPLAVWSWCPASSGPLPRSARSAMHFRFGRRRIASSRSRHNAARAAILVGRDRPVCWAMALWATPRDAHRMTAHFCTPLCGVVTP
jgi:hypothetical protein